MLLLERLARDGRPVTEADLAALEAAAADARARARGGASRRSPPRTSRRPARRTRAGALERLVSRARTATGAGATATLLLPEEFRFLSITQGSLSPEERRDIESHVTHTWRFLSTIPWTPDLARVPEIAYAHHEKLDGTGYPRRVGPPDIPPAARALTVCDIYDALTASDRPYKKAVPRDRALDDPRGRGGERDKARPLDGADVHRGAGLAGAREMRGRTHAALLAAAAWLLLTPATAAPPPRGGISLSGRRGRFRFSLKGKRGEGTRRGSSLRTGRGDSSSSPRRIPPGATRRSRSGASRTARRSPGGSFFLHSKKSRLALRSAPATRASSSPVRTAISARRSRRSRARQAPPLREKVAALVSPGMRDALFGLAPFLPVGRGVRLLFEGFPRPRLAGEVRGAAEDRARRAKAGLRVRRGVRIPVHRGGEGPGGEALRGHRSIGKEALHDGGVQARVRAPARGGRTSVGGAGSDGAAGTGREGKGE